MTAAAGVLIWSTVRDDHSRAATNGQSAVAVEDVLGQHMTTRLPAHQSARPIGARVVLLEYSDFQCPYCNQHARDTYPVLKREYVDTGKIAYGFVHFPLESLHPYSVSAAIAASCAGEQNGFWRMHDVLFALGQSLSASAIEASVREARLDSAAYVSCAARMDSVVRDQQSEGRRLGVTSTPTFLIGTISPDGTVSVRQRLMGASPVSVFRVAIEALLRQAAG